MPALVAGILMGGLSSASARQSVCGKRADILKQLSIRYSEAPVAMGLSSTGSMVELLSSRAGGSWTVIMTMPSGVSCLVAAGENWETVQPKLEGLLGLGT